MRRLRGGRGAPFAATREGQFWNALAREQEHSVLGREYWWPPPRHAQTECRGPRSVARQNPHALQDPLDFETSHMTPELVRNP